MLKKRMPFKISLFVFKHKLIVLKMFDMLAVFGFPTNIKVSNSSCSRSRSSTVIVFRIRKFLASGSSRVSLVDYFAIHGLMGASQN